VPGKDVEFLKEPAADEGPGMTAQGRDGQTLPFFGILAAVASLAIAVVFPLIKPLAWSVLLSFSVYPLFGKMREGPFRKRSDDFSAAATTGIIVLFAVLPCILAVVMALREGVRLYEFVLEVLAAMESTGEGALATLLPEWLVEHIRPWMVRYPAIRSWVRETAARGAVEAVSAAGDAALFLYYVSIITVSCFFLLRDGRYIVSYLREIVPLPPDQAAALFDRGKRTLQAVVYGVLLTSLVQGAAGGLGWLIAGLPNPMFFGALMAFFALIPFLGTAFVWLPGAAYLLAVSDWTSGLILLGWGVLVVGTVGRVLKALFISGGGKIHFFVVFVGIVGGLAAWGILGLFIGPPVMSLFLFLLENYRIMRKTRNLQRSAPAGADMVLTNEAIAADKPEKKDAGMEDMY
jgi:predicted PurR-regulated permease PerM